MTQERRGPGLHKTRGEPLYRVEEQRRFRSSDAGWRNLLEEADVVSEGAVRTEGGHPVWYGSTSLIVAVREQSALERAAVAEFAAKDAHLRLRAVRYALREAEAQAGTSLGPGHCDVRVCPDPLGLRIEVDVQAPLILRQGHGRMP